MARFQVVGLDTATPQLRGLSSADQYTFPQAFDIKGNVFFDATAANILEISNATAAQAIHVFNTRADASNGEWGAMRFNSNVLEIRAFANGTGVVRPISLTTTGGLTMVGSSFGGGIYHTAGAAVVLTSGNGISLTITDNFLQSAGLYRMHGVTSSFPALKRNGASLQFRLADDSGFADVQVRNAIENPVAALTFSTNGQYGVEMTSNTAGNLVYRGSDGTTRRCALVFV